MCDKYAKIEKIRGLQIHFHCNTYLLHNSYTNSGFFPASKETSHILTVSCHHKGLSITCLQPSLHCQNCPWTFLPDWVKCMVLAYGHHHQEWVLVTLIQTTYTFCFRNFYVFMYVKYFESLFSWPLFKHTHKKAYYKGLKIYKIHI